MPHWADLWSEAIRKEIEKRRPSTVAAKQALETGDFSDETFDKIVGLMEDEYLPPKKNRR